MKSRYLYSLVATLPSGDRITRHELPASCEEEAIEMMMEDNPDAIDCEIISAELNQHED